MASIALNNVSAQARVVPRIRIGASGCLAFVNSGLLKRQNQILGFAEDGGYVVQTAAPIHYFLPWLAFIALGIAVTVTRSSMAAAIATLVPAYIFYKLFELHGVLAGVKRKFASLDVSDNTAKVY
ncbi:MAG: hypothetical protein EOS07_18935 [Mesorhizobium sp.]|uniref:hypothetical protein n=1 Tax=Mesorhizobium sp. TaxID=1871066 RepID=UPI000FE300E6|nr:hypothetical protein [Mesorhizobium sp.]RWO07291.1 MAG: hypothetical protein EOS07_18935 [Mesorhizobium sp.]RWO16112.1 MAG: hypothetical protein EOS08_28010 [Mesorhizobium sp.]RWP31461.1 MAG: hypothetical protein EOR02_09015 [Mesorhizobium sp.]RWQ54957.1 MAG: hypothetical protein EOS83_17180 [Mesorhizobium sp.]TIL37758.1 MAG: hypothetical protein E5Y82_16830 [Mesorhizobium sp.]